MFFNNEEEKVEAEQASSLENKSNKRIFKCS